MAPGCYNEIDWSKNVVFLCRTGPRGQMMAELAGKSREVMNLQYGIYECFKDKDCKGLEILSDEVEGYF